MASYDGVGKNCPHRTSVARVRRRTVYSGYGYFLHFEQHFPSLQSGQHFSAVHLSQHSLASFAVAAKGRAISAAAIMAFSMVFMCFSCLLCPLYGPGRTADVRSAGDLPDGQKCFGAQ